MIFIALVPIEGDGSILLRLVFIIITQKIRLSDFLKDFCGHGLVQQRLQCDKPFGSIRSGPIFLPVPLDNLNIAADGTLSMRQLGAPANVIEDIGRLKLVSPNYADMERGTDGLFRMEDGTLAPANANVKVMSGMLEGSNVNAVEEMVDMINLQRHYELQVKVMKQAEELDTRGNTLLRIL